MYISSGIAGEPYGEYNKYTKLLRQGHARARRNAVALRGALRFVRGCRLREEGEEAKADAA